MCFFAVLKLVLVLLLYMCKILELPRLFVYLGDLLSFSVPERTEKIVGLWFARGGQYPSLHCNSGE